jgi:hypothetical protein
LTPGEEVLAIARIEPVLGPLRGYLVATDRRVLILRKSGLFSWNLSYIPPSAIQGAAIHEGAVRANVTIYATSVLLPDNVRMPQELTYPDVPKGEAAQFVSAVHFLADEAYPESAAYQTKRCPDCDEIVKLRARVCEHCGYRFG